MKTKIKLKADFDEGIGSLGNLSKWRDAHETELRLDIMNQWIFLMREEYCETILRTHADFNPSDKKVYESWDETCQKFFGFDKDITYFFPMSHENKTEIRLKADFDNGEGELRNLCKWRNAHSPSLRADILKDWMCLVEEEYAKTLYEMRYEVEL